MEADKLYGGQAAEWHRDEPKHHSDFCGRPEVFELFRELGQGKTVLDLGCGEGYFARQMAPVASRVVGVDRSKGMVGLAVEREQQEPQGIDYLFGDVRALPFTDSTFDLCVGNYVTNYLHPEELEGFYNEIARVSKPGAPFILLMPHPFFELTSDFGEAIQTPADDFDYIRDRGKYFHTTLKTVQGGTFEVGIIHSTLEDHSAAISAARLTAQIKELVFPEEIAKKYSVFAKLGGKVASMVLVGEKPLKC